MLYPTDAAMFASVGYNEISNSVRWRGPQYFIPDRVHSLIQLCRGQLTHPHYFIPTTQNGSSVKSPSTVFNI